MQVSDEGSALDVELITILHCEKLIRFYRFKIDAEKMQCYDNMLMRM